MRTDEQRPDLCPRVVGALFGRLVTCERTLPCPFHGAPAVRFLRPVPDSGGRDG